MEKIKLHLNAGQILLLGNMMQALLAMPIHGAPLQLERLLIAEYYRRHAQRFMFGSDKPLPLTAAEALAFNRVMQLTRWPITGAGGIATEIIRQIDSKMPDTEKENVKPLLLK